VLMLHFCAGLQHTQDQVEASKVIFQVQRWTLALPVVAVLLNSKFNFETLTHSLAVGGS
jgi:hypothetical protein